MAEWSNASRMLRDGRNDMWYVYIIQSIRFSRRYIGITSNYRNRINHHNRGSVPSTKPYRPYELLYLEAYVNKQVACKREKQLKSYKGGDVLKQLLKSWDGGVVKRNSL